MIAKLNCMKVRPDSYKSKDGTVINTLDLICMDMSEGERLGHAVVIAVDRHQKESLLNANLRDQVLEVDVVSVKSNFRGEIVFDGRILNADKYTSGGKLTVEKPDSKKVA